MSNIEFYEIIDPTKGDMASYIYDSFSWQHCTKADRYRDARTFVTRNAFDLFFSLSLRSIVEEQFTTGYLDGVTESSSATAAEGGLGFSTGVIPTVWGGAMSYQQIRASQTKPSVPISVTHSKLFLWN